MHAHMRACTHAHMHACAFECMQVQSCSFPRTSPTCSDCRCFLLLLDFRLCVHTYVCECECVRMPAHVCACMPVRVPACKHICLCACIKFACACRALSMEPSAQSSRMSAADYVRACASVPCVAVAVAVAVAVVALPLPLPLPFRCGAVRCRALPCCAVRCGTVWCSAVRCGTMRCSAQ